MRIIAVGFFTFGLGLALTILARRAAPRLGIVALPRQDRWHRKPTPMLGGAAIFLAFMAGLLLFGPLPDRVYPMLVAGSLLFVVGLVDDAIRIKPYVKLVAQLIAAATMVYFDFHLPWVNYQWINDVLTIFWLVGITNAINLLDNMDGLAGGVSVIACAFLAVTFFLNGQMSEAALPVLLGAAALGFLVFNFNPASIFMGDSGSMFIGFMLSSISLLADSGRFRSLTSVLLTPVLTLMLPIFDTCVVTVTRKLSGRPLSQGGRDHSSHRLVALGMSERRAVISLYAFAAVSGALALMVRVLETTIVLALVPLFALLVVFLGLHLGKVSVYEERAPSSKSTGLFNALADFTYKRRIFEVLLDVVLVVLSYYGAYVLRWDGRFPEEQLAIFLKTLPIVIITELLFFLLSGLYRGIWRYAGISDLLVVGKSVFAGGTMSALIVFAMYGFRGPSRAVFLLNILVLLFLTSASRLSFRLLRQVMGDPSLPDFKAKPVLIYGAGDSGEVLILEILSNPTHRYSPVGFIDDDTTRTGKIMHGFRIFSSSQLPDLIREHGISEVLISSLKVPEAKLNQMRNLGVSLKKMSIRIE